MMSAERLPYRTEVPVYRYSLILKSDDDRITDAVSDWVDHDIAGRHETDGTAPKIPIEIELHAGAAGVAQSIDAPRLAPTGAFAKPPPTGVFEDIEFRAGEKQTVVLFGGKSLVVVSIETGTARGFVASEHLASPWLLSHRIFYVPVLEIMRSKGAFYIHAGCVARGERCLLLCGGSGHGKSTLTYALSRSGFSYMSDDAVFIQANHAGVEVFAFPEKIKLDRKSRSYFAEFDRLEGPEGKMEIPARLTRIRDVAVRGEPYALIFTRIAGGGTSGLARLSKNEALVRLIAHSVSVAGRSSVEKQLDLLAMIAETSVSLELTVGETYEGVPGLLEEALFS
jgi:hypothetical protein